MTQHAEARLLADIGATYARFSVERVPGRFEHVAVLPCADYPGFTAVVQAYLDSLPAGIHPRHGAVAIANTLATAASATRGFFNTVLNMESSLKMM